MAVTIWFLMPTNMSWLINHANDTVTGTIRINAGYILRRRLRQYSLKPIPLPESIWFSNDEKIRKPEMVKNMSTPRNPPRNAP